MTPKFSPSFSTTCVPLLSFRGLRTPHSSQSWNGRSPWLPGRAPTRSPPPGPSVGHLFSPQSQLLPQRRLRHAARQVDASRGLHGRNIYFQNRHMVSLCVAVLRVSLWASHQCSRASAPMLSHGEGQRRRVHAPLRRGCWRRARIQTHRKACGAQVTPPTLRAQASPRLCLACLADQCPGDAEPPHRGLRVERHRIWGFFSKLQSWVYSRKATLR